MYQCSPTNVPVLIHQCTGAHPPMDQCSPTNVPVLTNQCTGAHLPMYRCSPTNVPVLTHLCTGAHLPMYRCSLAEGLVILCISSVPESSDFSITVDKRLKCVWTQILRIYEEKGSLEDIAQRFILQYEN
jgi:hypothetical protein